MLAPDDASNCRILLRYLTETDVASLCETVCNRLIVPTSFEEAIEVIIQYSASTQELLGRKKVKADALFKYLLSVGVDVSPKTSKTELVSKTLDLWKGASAAIASVPAKTGSNTINIVHTEINNYTVVQQQDSDGQKLALGFIEWFFNMLRSVHDSTSTQAKWGPEHFWPDSALTFHIETQSGQALQEKCEGAEAVSNKLASFVLQEGVALNPNTTAEGYKGVISPHGLAKVAVCGTLHTYVNGQFGDSVGTFEQCSGLLRDPNDGNRYKMKYCQLHIRVLRNHTQPNEVSLSENTVRALQS